MPRQDFLALCLGQSYSTVSANFIVAHEPPIFFLTYLIRLCVSASFIALYFIYSLLGLYLENVMPDAMVRSGPVTFSPA
jgi:hypothetical protein